MLTNLMTKAIKLFEKTYKGQGVEIRTVSAMDWRSKAANFKIECNLIALNKYYKVMVFIDDKNKDYRITELIDE